jgi:ABC-type Fe3+/spermidine/putrescine transport system ATPase subunit
MADRLAVMNRGKLVQVGSPIEVYRNPVSRMVAEFIGETNFIEGTLRGAGTDAGRFTVDTSVGQLAARCDSPSWQPAAGDDICLSIRPEALRLVTHPDATANRFVGRIVEATYLGAMAQYHLKISERLVLKITQMNPTALLAPSDDPVTATATAADVVMLPR